MYYEKPKNDLMFLKQEKARLEKRRAKRIKTLYQLNLVLKALEKEIKEHEKNE